MARSLTVARRFSLAYLALAALFGGAVGAFIVLVERPAPKPPPPWSAWQPTADSPGARQVEISNHVGLQYRLPSGKALVKVIAGSPGGPDNPINAVAIAKTLNPTQNSDIYSLTASDKTALYNLCGDGTKPKCSIPESKPSNARGSVLRREALELALYTFRYIDGVDSVVTFFPPQKGGKSTFAFFFVKDVFKDELHAPLQRTLPQLKTHTPKALSAKDQRTVDTLTFPREYRFGFQTGTNGSLVLVLVPVTA
jgi:hypothetical protein